MTGWMEKREVERKAMTAVMTKEGRGETELSGWLRRRGRRSRAEGERREEERQGGEGRERRGRRGRRWEKNRSRGTSFGVSVLSDVLFRLSISLTSKLSELSKNGRFDRWTAIALSVSCSCSSPPKEPQGGQGTGGQQITRLHRKGTPLTVCCLLSVNLYLLFIASSLSFFSALLLPAQVP